jgi:hypothetical protein
MQARFGVWAAAAVLAAAVFAAAGIAAAQSLSDLDLSTFESQTTEQQTQSHTNPFASGVSAAEDLAIEDLQLTGIVFQDENNGYALISGYLVRPGDRIAGYRVEKIEKDRVRLKRLTEVIVLALGGGI